MQRSINKIGIYNKTVMTVVTMEMHQSSTPSFPRRSIQYTPCEFFNMSFSFFINYICFKIMCLMLIIWVFYFSVKANLIISILSFTYFLLHLVTVVSLFLYSFSLLYKCLKFDSRNDLRVLFVFDYYCYIIYVFIFYNSPVLHSFLYYFKYIC